MYGNMQISAMDKGGRFRGARGVGGMQDQMGGTGESEARKVAEKLGVEVQFVIIDWDNKIMELDSKNIDVVWNGMTLTSETTGAMECTNAYCNNAQVVVVPAAK